MGSGLYGTTTNFNVQMHQGDPYLTFWAGDKHGGEGSGAAYMLVTHYNVHKKIEAVGPGLRTDLHEFVITMDGHALVSAINDTRADLRPLSWFRSQNGWIEDSVFQEIDVDSGDLVFQWRASDHFKPTDSHFWNPIGGYVRSVPYDFFHLNSVQKDSRGNYLVSARHLHRLVCIDGRTGETLWMLGGGDDANELTDLSGGSATSFLWQHHARWQSEEEGIVTLMDNGRTKLQRGAAFSKALMLRVNHPNRTVELLHTYRSLDHVQSPSQGSVQQLPNGNLLVGWDPMAAWSEHKSDGELLCEFHFAASWWFSWQRVKNYRTFKVYGWKGEPSSPPVAKVKGEELFVSWNGATEVNFWKLEGSQLDADNGKETFEHIETIEKQGFESMFHLPMSSDYESFHVAALDASGATIGMSERAEVLKSEGSWEGIIFAILFALGAAIGIWLAVTHRNNGQQAGQRMSWELPIRGEHGYSRLKT